MDNSKNKDNKLKTTGVILFGSFSLQDIQDLMPNYTSFTSHKFPKIYKPTKTLNSKFRTNDPLNSIKDNNHNTKQSINKSKSSWASLFKPTNTKDSNFTPNLNTNKDLEKTYNTNNTAASKHSEYMEIKDFLNNIELDFNYIDIIPRGILNLKNRCYMSAVVQSLLFCMPLNSLFKKAKQKIRYRINNENNITPLFESMINLFDDFKTNTNSNEYYKSSTCRNVNSNNLKNLNKERQDEYEYGEPYIPSCLYDALKECKRFKYISNNQEDAAEFLSLLLEELNNEMTNIICLTENQSNSSDNERDNDTKNLNMGYEMQETYKPDGYLSVQFKLKETNKNRMDQNNNKENNNYNNRNNETQWYEVTRHNQKAIAVNNKNHIEENNSLINNLFGGTMKSCVYRQSHTTLSTEKFTILPLNIANEDILTIDDALEHLCELESLEQTTTNNNTKTTAKKQMLFDKVPYVLVIELKQYTYSRTEGIKKLNKKIFFSEHLSIKKHMLIPNYRPEIEFELFSVIYHRGEYTSCGHYTVDIKKQDEWLYINDTQIERINSTSSYKLKNRNDDGLYTNSRHDDDLPYLLFYQRAKKN